MVVFVWFYGVVMTILAIGLLTFIIDNRDCFWPTRR